MTRDRNPAIDTLVHPHQLPSWRGTRRRSRTRRCWSPAESSRRCRCSSSRPSSRRNSRSRSCRPNRRRAHGQHRSAGRPGGQTLGERAPEGTATGAARAAADDPSRLARGGATIGPPWSSPGAAASATPSSIDWRIASPLGCAGSVSRPAHASASTCAAPATRSLPCSERFAPAASTCRSIRGRRSSAMPRSTPTAPCADDRRGALRGRISGSDEAARPTPRRATDRNRRARARHPRVGARPRRLRPGFGRSARPRSPSSPASSTRRGPPAVTRAG